MVARRIVSLLLIGAGTSALLIFALAGASTVILLGGLIAVYLGLPTWWPFQWPEGLVQRAIIYLAAAGLGIFVVATAEVLRREGAGIGVIVALAGVGIMLKAYFVVRAGRFFHDEDDIKGIA